MIEHVDDFLTFVSHSPTAFHAADRICSMLQDSGYQALNECESWILQPGGRYFVTRSLSSVIAFRIPECGMAHFQIIASHSDSPTFKLKPSAEDAAFGKYVRLNVEKYGGMIMSTWLDRPLSIAGRILVKKDREIETKLVDLARDAVLIPNMPIHFNREVNDGYHYNPQVDLLPLYGAADAQGALIDEIAASAHVNPDKIIGSDLFLYNRMPGSIWGAGNIYVSSPRIDELECAYTSLRAYLDSKTSRSIAVYAAFDNEEVGSTTKQGANSTFLTDVLGRASYALGASEEAYLRALSTSFMVSADNAHAVHPNHPEKYDAGNRTFMNEGVVIKHNANQRYTTDGVSSAIFESICRSAGVPVQSFSNRSDIAGGSTLGNLANVHASMNTLDIGLAQLAMHSSYETAGTKDPAYMIDALRTFYETDILTRGDGRYYLK